VVIGMHMLCLIPVFALTIPWEIRAVLASILLISLCLSLRQLPGRLQGLNLAMDGTFSVRLMSGEWVPAEVLDSSFVKPWLTVLHLRLEDRRRMLPLVLLADMLDPEDFRRLRVWLHWGRKES